MTLALFLVSAGVTVFVVTAAIILTLSGGDQAEVRLAEIAAARRRPADREFSDVPQSFVARTTRFVTTAVKPVAVLISGTDEDLGYRLTLAGFRKPEHVEIYTAA